MANGSLVLHNPGWAVFRKQPRDSAIHWPAGQKQFIRFRQGALSRFEKVSASLLGGCTGYFEVLASDETRVFGFQDGEHRNTPKFGAFLYIP